MLVMLIPPWEVMVPAMPGEIGPGDGGYRAVRGWPGGKWARYLTRVSFFGEEYGGGDSAGMWLPSPTNALGFSTCVWIISDPDRGVPGLEVDGRSKYGEAVRLGVGALTIGGGVCAILGDGLGEAGSDGLGDGAGFFSSAFCHHSARFGSSGTALGETWCVARGLSRSVNGVVTVSHQP
jgi:hypothetical protein